MTTDAVQKPSKRSCFMIVIYKACLKHEDGCREPTYAIGWITRPEIYTRRTQKKLFEALEKYGFDENLSGVA